MKSSPLPSSPSASALYEVENLKKPKVVRMGRLIPVALVLLGSLAFAFKFQITKYTPLLPNTEGSLLVMQAEHQEMNVAIQKLKTEMDKTKQHLDMLASTMASLNKTSQLLQVNMMDAKQHRERLDMAVTFLNTSAMETAKQKSDSKSLEKAKQSDSKQLQQKPSTVQLQANATSTLETVPWNASIVAYLTGEFGNNLGALNFAYGLKFWLEEEYGIQANVMLRRWELGNWRARTLKPFHQCIPDSRKWNFEAANTPEYDTLSSEQVQRWPFLKKAPYKTEEQVNEYLSKFKDILLSGEARPPNNTLSFPFIFADNLSWDAPHVDRYYDKLRQMFQWDPACCKLKPDPDETVFHFRGFITEMPKRGMGAGFEELDENATANELLGHLKPGDKVAIISRFADRNETRLYADAMERRGLKVRIIKGQNGLEDFCFMMEAKKEAVGIGMSTFAFWSSYFGNATSVKLYSVNSPRTRKSHLQTLWSYDFKNPALASRFKFDIYNKTRR